MIVAPVGIECELWGIGRLPFGWEVIGCHAYYGLSPVEQQAWVVAHVAVSGGIFHAVVMSGGNPTVVLLHCPLFHRLGAGKTAGIESYRQCLGAYSLAHITAR